VTEETHFSLHFGLMAVTSESLDVVIWTMMQK